MFRRRSTAGDESLAEAFRRLDGASTASTAAAPVAASSLAEAERVDAALRGWLQPVAAPDTLAGRVAGEIGRARVARWRRGAAAARRPVWAMAFAGAVVVVLVAGAALAGARGGGTIGERARGVGEWVRAVLGVGMRSDEADGEAYYWVPGMGILPLRPDAVVATGPVTVTDGYPLPLVIEGLVADSRGTRMVVRFRGAGPSNAETLHATATIYRGVPNGSRLTIRTCDISNSTFGHDLSRPEECVYGPLLLTERNSGVAHFGVPRSGRGHIEFFDDARSDANGRQQEGDFGDRDYARFLQTFQSVDVPIVSVASGKLRRAHRLGDDQVRGGVRLRAWGAAPAAGQLAVRVEPVDLAPNDEVRFVSADGDARTYMFGPDVSHMLAAIGLNNGTGASHLPVNVWEHAVRQLEDNLPPGRALDPAADGTSSFEQPRFPVTVLFQPADGPGEANLSLNVGPLLLAVDAESLIERTPLNGPNATTVRLDTVAATYAYTVNLGAAARSDMTVERYPVTNTLQFADRRLPIGFAVVIDRGDPRPADANPARVIHPPRAMITVHWSDGGSDGRQLVDLDVGRVQRTSLWSGLRRVCKGFGQDGGHGAPQTGPAPAMWRMVGGPTSDVLPSVTLCLSRPIFQIPGPWTFQIDQP